MKSEGEPSSLLAVCDRQLLLATKEGGLYQYWFPDTKKSYQEAQIYSSAGTVMASKTFTASGDCLIFVEEEELIQVQPARGRSINLAVKRSAQLQMDRDDLAQLVELRQTGSRVRRGTSLGDSIWEREDR